eukprot:4395263-Prymnesium_polylepis.1
MQAVLECHQGGIDLCGLGHLLLGMIQRLDAAFVSCAERARRVRVDAGPGRAGARARPGAARHACQIDEKQSAATGRGDL